MATMVQELQANVRQDIQSINDGVGLKARLERNHHGIKIELGPATHRLVFDVKRCDYPNEEYLWRAAGQACLLAVKVYEACRDHFRGSEFSESFKWDVGVN